MELSPIVAAMRPDGAREASGPAETDKLRAAAEAFEASFLAEMLGQTGINAAPGGFGGGAGETAFSSLLTEEYARLVAARGGIGLAERIFAVLEQGKTGA